MATHHPAIFDAQAARLRRLARRFAGQQRITFTCLSDIVIGSYFSESFADELQRMAPEPFAFVSYAPELAACDVVVYISHGDEREARALWSLRQQFGDDTLFLVWLWDNHISHVTNLHLCLVADIVFPSHDYCAGYLLNPQSLVSRHVPLCCAQWTGDEAAALFARYGTAPRLHRLLVNYVDYPFSSAVRREALAAYAKGLAQADVLTMSATDRSRYFGLSREQRFAEWARYKATIILPVDGDLSTRLFDALLAGQVPIVPDYVADFDAVVPPQAQRELGIVRVDSLDLATMSRAADAALATFDAMGADGAVARHRFALEHHMLPNRVTSMLHAVWLLGDGTLDPELADGGLGPVLCCRAASA